MARKQKTTNKLLTTTPLPTSNQKIARVLSSRGKNLFEVEYVDTANVTITNKSATLCRLPPKFRNLVWVKRGSFVIITLLNSDRASKNKIGGEIVHVLLTEHVKQLKLGDIWPKEFDNTDNTRALETDNNKIIRKYESNGRY
ncbi:10419_t:CDS:2 [Ambispora leptoticha]|uniref:10419_t:CDS:1 n=1 Tax=Ambispora leptoticha TaxID=144679 RepID=A0A9N9HF46_9GLOM|nr:10419_t:CDS:2 [Ambispora leptoticha]